MELHILPPQFSGDPEALAMLQAFYSRSAESIVSRVERLGTNLTSVKAALNRFYIGYGHQSIGDCGTITVFVENVSILAAKALQENPLYNGQECSTRYIELSGQVYKPSHATGNWAYAQRQINEAVLKGIRAEHPHDAPRTLDPKAQEASHKAWQNATAARAFDIARGWITCGTLTNLSISLTMRKFNDFTTSLMAHPLAEVRDLALALRTKLQEHYPSGIATLTDKDQAVIDWLKTDGTGTDLKLGNWYLVQGSDNENHDVDSADDLSNISTTDLDFINSRPRHAELPLFVNGLSTVTMYGNIDYGTWRDMQRHRRNQGLPPAIKPKLFYSWYLEQVKRYTSPDFYAMVEADTLNMMGELANREWTPELQYDCPLGTVVPYAYDMGLAQAIYFAELRSGNTVHAILRPIAQQVAKFLTDEGFRVDYDDQPGRFDLRRGTQTITEKE